MKPITIDIDAHILDKFTADSSSITNFIAKGSEVMSCTIPNHVLSFPQLAIRMLELFAIGKSDCDYRKIKTATESFGLVTIKGNPDNGAIFDLFRKFGIMAGNLTIGVSGTKLEPKVYTTAKMMKDISKFAPDVQAALALTLYNIATLAAKVIVKVPAITSASVTSKVICDTGLDQFVVSYTGTKNITVAEIPTDEYMEIQYYNNKYSNLSSTYPGALQYAIVASTKDDGSVTYADAKIVTAISYSSTVYPILLDKTGVAKTTMELTSFESAKDSYITFITVPYELPTIKVCKVDATDLKDSLPSNPSIINILEDIDAEEEFMTEGSAGITKWNYNAKTFLHEGLEEKVYTNLSTIFGVKTVAVAGALDYDAMVDLYKDDEYAKQLYAQIQPYYADFDLGTLAANLKGFAKGDLYSLLFIGESGTGKSTAARVIPARCGIPYVSINCSINTEESDIFGSMVPNTKKVSDIDPEFIWEDGILTKAIRNGYCAILEEVNLAKPGVLGKLNSLLDDSRQVELSTGEIIKAHPNFRVIGTGNIGYEGTNRMNKSFINRFDDCTVFPDIPRAKAIEIIKTRTGYKNMTKIDVVLNVYEALKKYSNEQNLRLVVSVRQLLNIFSKGKYYTDAKDAVVRMMLNGAFIEEPEYKEEFINSVLPSFKLNFKI